MQAMQREKAMAKTGRPTLQDVSVGTPMEPNVRQKQTNKDKSSKKHK